MSFEGQQRWADWLGHIVQQVDRLHAIMGEPIDISLLESGLNSEGALRCLAVISEAVARLHRVEVDLAALEPSIPLEEGARLRQHRPARL